MLARHIPDIIIIFSLEQIMVNKCAAPSCRSGYTKNKIKHKISFSFEKFRTEQVVDSICQPQRLEANKTVLCGLHFEEKYIVRGGKSNLKWSMNPIPTKHSTELQKMPLSLLPTSKTTRKGKD